ncbi:MULTISPECIES: hypothetical protein [Asaia]|uniref:Uncharacterized protein n=1 Tax=Asaia spathodeae TaxID=657016 RepID=A0ABX2P2Q5_9PROT|nr:MULTISPECIES: hypothetical protein [Asaia]GBR13221.1 hypothetical protein AA105894_0767 [Asaia spathodeae NBRC 105894]
MAQTLPFPKNETPAPLSNVIPLRFNVLPRHREYLSQWLQAGLAMGLCDADIETECFEGRDEAVAHILIWVRENADPAYMIKPRGLRWVLIDHIREHELGVYASLELALHTVRPVLPLKSIAAA